MTAGISIKGANILARSLMIFRQVATRCHHYVFKEMQAAHHPDTEQVRGDLDKALFGHIAYTVRALTKGLTGSHFIAVRARPGFAAEKDGVFDGLPEANVRDIAQVAFAKAVAGAGRGE